MSRKALLGITVGSVAFAAVCLVASVVAARRQAAPPITTLTLAGEDRQPAGEKPGVPDPPTWSKSDPGQVRGAVRVRLARVEVKRIPIMTEVGLDRKKETSPEPCFSVAVEVNNVSTDQIVRQLGWSSPGLHSAELRDDLGNRYDIDGQSPNSFFREAIRPGDPASLEVIVFEMPLPQAKYLDLILPGEAFDWDLGKTRSTDERRQIMRRREESIRFRIPVSEVSRS